jgi:hypothetical protein
MQFCPSNPDIILSSQLLCHFKAAVKRRDKVRERESETEGEKEKESQGREIK